jgi:hypothetical protein
MRTLFLALMIALLPLRGWVGDVMAMELAAAPTPAHAGMAMTAHGATPGCHETAAFAAGHHGHDLGDAATVQPAGAEPDPNVAHAGDGHCTLCQICHSVALAPVLLPLPAAVLPLAAPVASPLRYTSAERTLGDKPPIS